MQDDRESRPAVSARGLGRRFSLQWAVRDVTFVLPPRSVLLVVGPNASGKTTLLRLLATALRPTDGGGSVFGRDLVRDANAVRVLTALVGTSAGAYDLLTVRENFAFAAAMRGRPDAPVATWLDRVGLTPVADDPVRGLSSGMKRRLALAQAWLAAPRLLLLGFVVGSEPARAAAILWVAMGFAAVLGIPRVTQGEVDQQALETLLLYPGSREHLYWGKCAALTVMLSALLIALLVLLGVLFGVDVWDHGGALVGVGVLGIVGLSVIGTLLAALVLHVRGRELLMPLLLLPLALPVVRS